MKTYLTTLPAGSTVASDATPKGIRYSAVDAETKEVYQDPLMPEAFELACSGFTAAHDDTSMVGSVSNFALAVMKYKARFKLYQELFDEVELHCNVCFFEASHYFYCEAWVDDGGNQSYIYTSSLWSLENEGAHERTLAKLAEMDEAIGEWIAENMKIGRA